VRERAGMSPGRCRDGQAERLPTGARCTHGCRRRAVSPGYVRIVGELRKLGINVSATVVRSVLAEARIPPAPQRDRNSWRTFLRQHGDSILACDFLTVDTVWLRRLYVLVFLTISSRRVEHVACTSNPDTASASARPLDRSRRARPPRCAS
jgi:hypothetical protein